MKDETATDELLPDEGAEDAQPIEAEDEAAGNEPEESKPDQGDASTGDTQPDATGTTDDEVDYVAWAEKKGIDLTDPAIAAKSLYHADQKVSEAGKRSKMEQEIDRISTDDPDPLVELMKRQAKLETQLRVTDYYAAHPDYRELDEAATAILRDYAAVDEEYARKLAQNLPDLFALARARRESDSVAKAKEEGRLEERRALASKQRASSVSPAATTQERTKKDPFIEAFDSV